MTNMTYMFYGCSALTTLDVSNFVTSQVTDKSDLFSWCQKLSSLKLTRTSATQARLQDKGTSIDESKIHWNIL